MNRVTEWRHRKGISQKRCPKERIDYFAVAYSIGRRYFPILLSPKAKEDFIQECRLLELEAVRHGRIYVYATGKRKAFAGGKNGMGMRSFSRAVQCHLHQMLRRYGWFKSGIFYYQREIPLSNLLEDYYEISDEI